MVSWNDVETEPNVLKVLDHGFVLLEETMGTDQTIADCARISYGKGTRKVSEDRHLIRYLMKHQHTSPFEMCELRFLIKLPIFVARQWVRHRTASINEESARYSVMKDDFYVPERKNLKPQSQLNKQGREGEMPELESEMIQNTIKRMSEESYREYLTLLNEGGRDYPIEGRTGLARELARTVLPVNLYTTWYWKTDLHNLFHFLKLRMDEHAQFEIREYANAVFGLTKKFYPVACEAFEDYQVNGVSLSGQAFKVIQDRLSGAEVGQETSGLSKREWAELMSLISAKHD